ncbi:aminopeptidase P family N-terminal domain-containing protein [Virgibacillus halophilus]|uniref:Aminopeptidase P family N-terminal domain-containing protein n=1 Tax=Tigheibacillus halophilus TaxID=361280 RepID=A0ABU5C2N6_9BACI|nr:aminopeptidase P family N-terminal domain-containing protein [Virgibacillus halophilus]
MDTTKRVGKLREIMDDKKIDLAVIMHFENQFYFSGLKAITYSRPIVLTVDSDKLSLIVPSLEENHAKTMTKADKLYVYHETFMSSSKGGSHIEHLKTLISSYPTGTRVGVEFSSLPIQLGNMMREAGLELVNLDNDIQKMRYIKDEEEIELITESGRLVSLALKESLENAKAGLTEMEVDQFGNQALFAEVARKHPNATLDFFVMTPSGIDRSILPHVFSNTRKFDENDISIHSRQVGLNGYRAECERTFFISVPTDRQKELFKIAHEAQLAALDTIKVGITAKEVNEVARQIFKKTRCRRIQYSQNRSRDRNWSA